MWQGCYAGLNGSKSYGSTWHRLETPPTVFRFLCVTLQVNIINADNGVLVTASDFVTVRGGSQSQTTP